MPPSELGGHLASVAMLGHKSDNLTTHWSAPQFGSLIAAAGRICEVKASRESRA